MTKLCILISTYHPFHSANSRCIANIVENIGGGYEITVIASDLSGVEPYVVNGVAVVPNPGKNKLGMVARVSAFRRRACNPNSMDIEKKNYFVRALKSLKSVQDIVIPVCFPIESLAAAFEYKKLFGVKVIPYLLDVVSTSATAHTLDFLKNLKLNRNVEFERSIPSKADAVIVNESWSQHFKKLNRDCKNVFLLGHPLVADVRRGVESSAIKKGVLFYGGALGKKVRSPDYFLSVMDELLHRNRHLIVQICHRGDCGKSVSALQERHPGFSNLGSIKSDLATALMLQAEFLVLIGNNNTSQFQSKAFEYVSVGAPIIFFCKERSDPVLDVLAAYPNALVVFEGEHVSTVVEKLEDFIVHSSSNDRLPYEKVSEIYHENTVKYISAEFSSLLATWG
ncbi:hypothetical protein [Pseudomonas sp.]|uniref:hypothetical protein n=1 Tax=Pseudomonas sp. TaxID=306 RepID=UPI0028AD1332|nr:hypothetical protein [Pseudomonas sp.]